jgi:pimeloyl-ACP methyl ester carboxylesterase
MAGPAAFLGPLRTVPVGDVTLAFRRFGHGPALLLLEGQQMTMTQWPLSFLQVLGQSYDVTMVDYRGVGASTDVVSEPMTIELLADDVATFVAAVGLAPVTVFGWSTGGEVALALAVRHPGVVQHLALVGATTGGKGMTPTPPAIEKVFDDPNTPPLTLLGLLFPAGDKTAVPQYVAELAKLPQVFTTAATEARQNAAEAAWAAGGVEAQLAQVPVPVLAMNGAADQLVPPANAQHVAALMPNSTLLLVPGGGHMAFFPDPSMVLTALASLVSR